MRLWKLLLLLLSSSLCLAAQPDRIPGPIDSSQMVVLSGNVHRKALPQYDRGLVESALPFSYVTLVIAPSPSQQIALDQLLAQQQDRSSPYFHKWLTPEQYADRFGLSENDVNKITSWLKSQGFAVLMVARGRNSITFSGTAAQIQDSFDTEIHRYDVNGEKHIANSTPVQIPAALSGVVTGVHGLTDFRPKPMYVHAARGDKSGPHPAYTTTRSGTTNYFLAPGDVATLYDINPLYNATTPIDGTGQKLAIIGQTDVYLADLVDFRSGFSLPSFTCATGPTGLVTSCDTANFRYVLVGADQPVSVGDLIEADLDIEWSGAVAPNAQIIFVNAPISPSEISGGVNDALAYAIDNNVAPVISMSYGLCEAENESLETELKQGNAEGITILNSAGDTGSFACDDRPPGTTSTFSPNPPFAAALGGLGVNYPASSPEVTGVGGTSIPAADFTSAFWSATNGTNGGSALTTLIGQELSWNDDEAFAQFCQANPTNAFCENGGPPAVSNWVPLTSTATAAQVQEDIWISIGGGGVSNCINNTGICAAGFPRPAWQQAITIPSLASPQSTFRFLPDISLAASPNFPGYIICTPQEEVVANSSSTTSTCSPGGAAGISTGVDTFLSLVGGTSASTPVFAGIVTLLNQFLGSSGLGNINPTLYALAQTPSNGAFHPVKSGDNNVFCQKGTPAGQPSYVICPPAGVAGFSAASADTTTGYNLVTGLGSVDANALATAWAASRTATSITMSTPSTNVFAGAPVTFTVAVTPSTGVGTVKFSTLTGGSTAVLGTATLNTPFPGTASGTAAFTTATLPSGSNSVTATFEGDASHGGSTSAAAVVTVTTPFTMLASPTGLSVSAGQTAAATITITPAGGFNQPVTFTNSTVSSPGSCTAGLPAGALCTFSQGSVSLNGASPSTVVLTISTAANMALPSGPQIVTITGTSGSAAISTTVNLTISKTTESFTLSSTAATFPISVGGTAKIQVAVNSTTGFVNSSNSTTALPLTYTCSGIPIAAEISCQVSTNGQPTNASSVTVDLVTTPVTTELTRPPLGRSRIFYALLLPALFGIVFVRPRTRGSRLFGLIVVLGLCTLELGSCGGNNNSNSGLKNAGTPPGSYAVTINATTGAPTGGTALVNSNAPFTVTLAVSP